MSRSFSMSRLSFAVFSLAAVLTVGLAQPVFAQTEPPSSPGSLDDVLRPLLDNQCAALFDEIGSGPQFTGALETLCNLPPFSGTSSSGGGAASVQSSMIAVKNDVIQRRTDRARGAGNNTSPDWGPFKK